MDTGGGSMLIRPATETAARARLRRCWKGAWGNRQWYDLSLVPLALVIALPPDPGMAVGVRIALGVVVFLLFFRSEVALRPWIVRLLGALAAFALLELTLAMGFVFGDPPHRAWGRTMGGWAMAAIAAGISGWFVQYRIDKQTELEARERHQELLDAIQGAKPLPSTSSRAG